MDSALLLDVFFVGLFLVLYVRAASQADKYKEKSEKYYTEIQILKRELESYESYKRETERLYGAQDAN